MQLWLPQTVCVGGGDGRGTSSTRQSGRTAFSDDKLKHNIMCMGRDMHELNKVKIRVFY